MGQWIVRGKGRKRQRGSNCLFKAARIAQSSHQPMMCLEANRVLSNGRSKGLGSRCRLTVAKQVDAFLA